MVKPKYDSIVEASESGDYREELLALKAKLAEMLDETSSARETGTLVARYQEVAKELAEMPEPDDSPIDKIKSRSKARKTAK